MNQNRSKHGYFETYNSRLAYYRKNCGCGELHPRGQLRNRLRIVKLIRFKYYTDPIFLASLGAYFLNRLLVKPHWPRHWILGPFIHDHFNDSLLVPVALPIFLAFYRAIHLRGSDQAPTLREVLGHVVLWSYYFEVFAPRFLHHGTADLGDAISYLVGGLTAWGGWRAFYSPRPEAVLSP